MEPEEGAHAGDLGGHLFPSYQVVELAPGVIPEAAYAVVLLGGHHLHGCQSGGHGYRVGVEGAAVMHLVPRAVVEDFHHVVGAGHGAHWEPTPDYLCQRGEVGVDAEVVAGPLVGNAEADYLVGYQENAEVLCNLPDLLQESRCGRHPPEGGGERVDNDRCQFVPMALDYRGAGVDVVPGHGYDFIGDPGGDAGLGDAGGEHGIAPVIGVGGLADLGVVIAAVVSALNLGNLELTRAGPGGLYAEHHGLAPGVAEAELVYVVNSVDEEICEFDLGLGGHGEGGASLQLLAHRFDDGRVGVAVDERGHVVDKV